MSPPESRDSGPCLPPTGRLLDGSTCGRGRATARGEHLRFVLALAAFLGISGCGAEDVTLPTPPPAFAVVGSYTASSLVSLEGGWTPGGGWPDELSRGGGFRLELVLEGTVASGEVTLLASDHHEGVDAVIGGTWDYSQETRRLHLSEASLSETSLKVRRTARDGIEILVEGRIEGVRVEAVLTETRP